MDFDEEPSRWEFYFLGVSPEEEENYKFQCRLKAQRCTDIRQDSESQVLVKNSDQCWKFLAAFTHETWTRYF